MPKKCKSKAKTTGKRCRKDVVPGYNVCHIHGGKTPRGWANPNTKHARHSQYVPERLEERFETAINDADIQDMSAELALLDTRIGEMISNIDTENYGSIWNEIIKATLGIKKAMNSGQPLELIAAYNHLESIVEYGADEQSTWDSITKYIEQRRKLVESLHKINTTADNIVTIDELMLSIVRVVGIIREHVTDKEQLMAITADIGAFVNAEA